ncbi:anthranilate synthase component I family protein [Paenibacillus mucilaginosus]|uniref:Anthranilate synthase n=3 Tax=Paenibacillus mucilaginosus TaxID=61624 RepID=H6NSE2_9BACL|nr:anthranilate synthase component I family protein [Paenibacillus mucilaginosus]AEI46060.1 Anthranilate synthase [Paenibacillus mucilaginosus KNP414]AFC33692.1 Anthranilate synthase [Paenibacillus mucilaginosus 3016]AFH66025.1 anthranilate synthase [Paenibacillus mucilaginosus K02]MCG7217900.1 anthranilate synthase component I family protein [Paenibacillus mucilaginosus]WDM27406.1 anthranilate synthase component I family protein [Paenibacillus mucilaginosus]
MILTSLEQWQQWAGAYTVLPYIRRYALEETRPASWLGAWEQAAPGSFVLESGKGGRYTFLGLQPRSEIRGRGLDMVISGPEGVVERGSLPPLEAVKRWMAPYRAPYVDGAPKWTGGCVGFWGYDVIRTIERLPVQAAADLPLPDYAFVRVDELWIIDHQQSELFCAVSVYAPDQGDQELLNRKYAEAAASAERMYELWNGLMASNQDQALAGELAEKKERMSRDLLQIDVDAIPGIQADFPREAYVEAVRRIRDYIGAGDVFQVNLSVRQHKKLESTPEEIYEWLRLVNPSPYMGMLRFADFQLVSGSPELLVQLERGTVRTRPIAGTRPRGASPEEDRRLADELIHHEKERAEHIMLVDLERNDLGRISKYGTVRVSDFMVIEYYSHVMHIVSEVEGELAQGKDAFDVIGAAFPGGTITGAPKIRTMEIIEELEPVRRGPYTGSIGWIDYNGDMEFNIIIRTLVVAEGTGYVQAGAGIVIDSIPEKEYMESINKAKAMWKAIQYSEAEPVARRRG